MGMVGELEITLIVPTLQRGNASQDAPRPLANVSQSVVGACPCSSAYRHTCHALGSPNPQSAPFVTRSVTMHA